MFFCLKASADPDEHLRKSTKIDDKNTKKLRTNHEQSTKIDQQSTKINENPRKSEKINENLRNNYENRNQRYHYAAFSSPTPNFALPTLETI